MDCDGLCDEHEPPVHKVLVSGHGYENEEMWYCLWAIRHDRDHGFIVEEQHTD